MGLFTVYLSLLNIFKDILEYFLENMAGRYWPVFICLQNIFLKYFWIFLENMGGRYGRVYLSLLWIYVLNKFLGFLVDPKICQMEKVVWNLKLHLYQIISNYIEALTRSLWDGQSCLKFVPGRSSTVPLQTWVPAVTNLPFNYYLLLQKSSFQVGKPQAGTSFQNSFCQI